MNEVTIAGWDNLTKGHSAVKMPTYPKTVKSKARAKAVKSTVKNPEAYGSEAFKLVDSVIWRSDNFRKPQQMKTVLYDLPYSLVPVN